MTDKLTDGQSRPDIPLSSIVVFESYKSALRKAIEEEIEKESRHIRESYNDVRKRHELKRGIWHQCLMKMDTVTPE